MERSGADLIFQASHPSTRFPFQRSKDSRERDGGRVEIHVGGGSHSRQQVEIVGGQIDVKMVRHEEGGPGLPRLAKSNGCDVRGAALVLRGDERVLHYKPKKYGERMPIRITIHDERTSQKVWIWL